MYKCVYVYIHIYLSLCIIYYHYHSRHAIFINIQVIVLKSGGPAPPFMNCTHVQLYISFRYIISLTTPIIDYYLAYITPSYLPILKKKKKE